MSSEVQSRPAASRGRGAGRGGRGGYSRGGARQQVRSTNGDSKHFDSLDSVEDEGEIGELKKRYGAKTSLIKEMFPDWSDVDILFALQETDGDENLTVTRIAEGTISQWGEVSKQKKDRSKPKPTVKDATFTTTTGDAGPGFRAPRGGRTEGTRGRGRGTPERGGRSARGRSQAPPNGTHADKSGQLSVPTEESSAWDNHAKSDDEAPAWPAATSDSTPTPAAATVASPAKPPAATPEPPQKTWASMLRQSTAPKPAPPKPKAAPAPPPPAEVIEPLPPVAEPVPAEEPAPAPVEMPAEPVVKETPQAPIPEIPTVIPEVALPPSQDQLTETNLEQITDISNPPDTETARSEAADSWDPHAAAALSATATPLSASQQQHQAQQAGRAATSGYATTALKATERSATRTPSFGRRLLDQEEAVRMPGNREVDRTTVQFGALNFSGLEEDIDGDREEPETRTQPPDDSPVSHPRTSLPVAQPAAVPDSFAAQKPAAVPAAAPPTGPAAATPSALAPQQPAAAVPSPQQPQQPPISSQPSQPQGFGRFAQDQQQSYGQKSFDAFAQQNAASAPPAGQHQFDSFASSQAQSQAHSQASAPAPAPAPAQVPATALSSAPNDFSSYYTADHQGRGPYSYYNQNYGQQQQGMQGQQDGIPSRSLGGYSAAQTENLSQYPQSVPAPASSRFSAGSALDAQGSGNNTPNPAGQSQQQVGQTAQSQSHVQQAQHANQYPYGQHPYSYNGPYYAYMSQFQTGFNQGGYGAPYGKQAGVYGQPNQYGMSPNAPYDHGSSGASGFGQQSSLHRGDSLGSGLGDYGRASAQQSGNQGLGSGGFGGMHDSFARNASSYQSQAGQGFGNQGQQPGGAPSGNDDLKPFGDSKAAGGPSPSISGARPISAANNAQAQQGLPPSQSGQQGAGGMGSYGGYPSHLQQQQQGHGLHGAQSGAGGYGLGGAAAQGHGNSPYGGYGNQGFGGGSYYGNQHRGWGGNYP